MPSGEWSAASARVKPATAALVVSVLQVAAACDDGTYGGDINDGTAVVGAHQRNRCLGTEDVAHQIDAELEFACFVGSWPILMIGARVAK